MNLNDILVIAAAAVVIAGLAWWFFGPETAAETAEAGGVQEIRVKVRGGAARSAHADPVAKVTILPAGQALGVTEQLPLVERHLYGEDYLTETLAVRLGGRAAELIALGQGSTGAANDLAGATELAVKMVREFGLSPALGPVGYPEGGSVFLGGGGPGLSSRPFAEATQAAIDAEVARRSARPRSRPPGCCALTVTSWTSSPGCCWNRRPSTAPRSTGSPASPPRTRPAGRPWHPGGSRPPARHPALRQPQTRPRERRGRQVRTRRAMTTGTARRHHRPRPDHGRLRPLPRGARHARPRRHAGNPASRRAGEQGAFPQHDPAARHRPGARDPASHENRGR